MNDHDAVVRLYADQIIEQADASEQGEPTSALATSIIDKAMMHFRTIDNGDSAAALLGQLAEILRDAADAPDRGESSRDVLHVACHYVLQAAQALPD